MMHASVHSIYSGIVLSQLGNTWRGTCACGHDCQAVHVWTNDASSCLRAVCMMTWLQVIHILLDFSVWFAAKPAICIDIHGGVTDGLTDRRMDRPSYRDPRRQLVSVIYLLGHAFARKCLFPLFLISVTDGWTDWRIDPLIEMQGRI